MIDFLAEQFSKKPAPPGPKLSQTQGGQVVFQSAENCGLLALRAKSKLEGLGKIFESVEAIISGEKSAIFGMRLNAR